MMHGRRRALAWSSIKPRPRRQEVRHWPIDTLDEAIRLRDKVLLILSAAAIASDWVEDEVTKRSLKSGSAAARCCFRCASTTPCSPPKKPGHSSCATTATLGISAPGRTTTPINGRWSGCCATSAWRRHNHDYGVARRLNGDATQFPGSARGTGGQGHEDGASALVLMTLHRPQRAHPPQRADATSPTIIAAILLRDSASSSAADLTGRCSPVQRNCTRSSGTLLA